MGCNHTMCLRVLCCSENKQRLFTYTKMKIFSIQCSPISEREILRQKVHRLQSNGGMILTGETEVQGEKYYTAWVVNGWMSVGQWWNDTDRENYSTGRKILYSEGVRWMNE